MSLLDRVRQGLKEALNEHEARTGRAGRPAPVLLGPHDVAVKDSPPEVPEAPPRRLKTTTAAVPSARPKTQVQRLRSRLRDPAAIREAILLSELLAGPFSMRNRSRRSGI